MRIIEFYDGYGLTGRIATYFNSICRMLKKKHDVFIFVFSKIKSVRGKNIYVYRRPETYLIDRFISAYIFNFNVYFKFKDWLERIKPDIIHFHQNYKTCNSILLATKKQGIKSIATIHDYIMV